MSSVGPYVVRVPRALFEGRVAWPGLLAKALECAPARTHALVSRFEFRCDEALFAREILERKHNVRVFRCNQQRFCGDFALVDMSSPDPARRPVYVLDLKLGGALRKGGGGAGVQFRNAGAAVRALAARTGVVPDGHAFELLAGDRREVLRYLGAC